MAKGMGDLLKQAQMMQTKMETIQKELGNKRVEASVGGGMVKVTADGQQNILDIKISPEIIKPEEADMLQDLVLSGVQEAIKHVPRPGGQGDVRPDRRHEPPGDVLNLSLVPSPRSAFVAKEEQLLKHTSAK